MKNGHPKQVVWRVNHAQHLRQGMPIQLIRELKDVFYAPNTPVRSIVDIKKPVELCVALPNQGQILLQDVSSY